MSDEVLEQLVAEVVALRQRVAALETKELPGKFLDLLVSNDGRFGGGLAVGSTSNDPVTGAIDFPEISAPSTPGSNIARVYARETASGRTNMFMKGDAGTEWVMSVGQGACAYRSSNQTISSGAWVPIDLTGESWDNDVCHDNAVNPSRVIAKTPGIYQVSGNIVWTSNSTGDRGVCFRVNGSGYSWVSLNRAASSVVHISQTSGPIRLDANWYVELMAYQNTGSPLDTTAHWCWCTLAIVRVGPF